MQKTDSVLNILTKSLRKELQKNNVNMEKLQEIRIRIGKPVYLKYDNKEKQISYVVSKAELQEILEYVSHYSLYAYENEMKQGFLTIEGGHRIGFSGKININNGIIQNFQYIYSVNIRICHEIKGCADQILPMIIENNEIQHTLIISPPGQGKTTILRDLIRQISNGNHYLKGKTVSVIDERSEIGGCYQGIPQNDIGSRTDILDACPKAEGMMMMIRSMSPQILAVDEIGTSQDADAISYAMKSGVTILATAHANSLDEIKEKHGIRNLYEKRCFQRYIFLESTGRAGMIHKIYDAWGEQLCI